MQIYDARPCVVTVTFSNELFAQIFSDYSESMKHTHNDPAHHVLSRTDCTRYLNLHEANISFIIIGMVT